MMALAIETWLTRRLEVKNFPMCWMDLQLKKSTTSLILNALSHYHFRYVKLINSLLFNKKHLQKKMLHLSNLQQISSITDGCL
jgi:hypothetical protein